MIYFYLYSVWEDCLVYGFNERVIYGCDFRFFIVGGWGAVVFKFRGVMEVWYRGRV